MNEVVAVALISGIVPACVSVAIFGISKFSELKLKQQDNREWYKRTLFERRLAAVHEANSWLAKVGSAIIAIDPAKGPTQEQELHLTETSKEALQWLAVNSLYVYGSIPQSSAMGGFFRIAGTYAQPGVRETIMRLQQAASDEWVGLARGVVAVMDDSQDAW